MPAAVGAVIIAGINAAAGTAIVAGATVAIGSVAIGTIGSLVGSAAMMIAGAAYGSYAKRSASRKATAEYNASLSDRSQTYRSAEAARTIIYGETRVNALLTFASTHGAKRENVTMVLTFAGYPIDGYKTFWADDVDVGLPNTSDWLAPNGFAKTETLYETAKGVSTGAGWTFNLADVLPSGATLTSVDSVTYIQTGVGIAPYNETLSVNNYADQAVLLAPPGTPGGSQWSLASTVVTVSASETAGKTVVISYRATKVIEKKLKLKYYTGNESDANLVDTDLITASDNPDPTVAQWETDHKGFGIARVHATMTWDETIYANGLPNISAITRGRRVYDPRTAQSATDTTTWTWSENPALCVADYIRLGCNASSTDIDWTSVAEAANICDEIVQAQADFTITGITNAASALITTSTKHKMRTGSRFYITACSSMSGMVRSSGDPYTVTRVDDYRFTIDKNSSALPTFSGSATGRHVQKRFTCNGMLSTEADVKSNLEQLLSSMLGICIYSGGKFIIRAGAYRTPLITLDESDLAEGSVTVQARAPRADLFNSVRGTFRDPGQNYAVTDFDPYIGDSSTPNDYVTEDGGDTIFEDVELPFTDDAVAAQRLAKLILRRHRQAVAFEGTFKIYAYAVQPGDTVRLSLARYGWNGTFEGGTGKIFRVIDREFINLSTVKLSLIEEASAIYGWTFDSDAVVVDPSPNTLLPRPSDVETPTVYQPEVGYYSRADGVRVSFMRFKWAAPIATDAHMEIYWKRAGGTTYSRIVVPTGQTEWLVENVGPTEYFLAYFQFVNSVGARGSSVFLSPFNTGSMPSERPPVSANLLKNAALDLAATSWETALFNASGASISFLKAADATSVVLGYPSSAYIEVSSNLTGDNRIGAVYSELISVIPGQLYAAYASLISFASSSFVIVIWYDSSNTQISGTEVYGNVITETHVLSSGTWNNPSNYKLSYCFATAPSNARYARLQIAVSEKWTSDPIKYCSVYRPFFGAVAAGTSVLPPWDPGGANVVSTSLLAQNAATLVYESRKPAGPVPWLVSGQSEMSALPIVVIPTDADIEHGTVLRVHYSMTLSMIGKAGIGSHTDVAAAISFSDFAINAAGQWAGASTLGVVPNDMLTTAPGYYEGNRAYGGMIFDQHFSSARSLDGVTLTGTVTWTQNCRWIKGCGRRFGLTVVPISPTASSTSLWDLSLVSPA